MTRNTSTPYVANTTKKMHLSTIILNEFTSTYYENTDDCFEILFQKYTASSVNNINHPSLIQ